MMVKVSGFWTGDTFTAYAVEAARRTKELVAWGGFKSLLIDMSDYPLQGRAVADRHGQLLVEAQQRFGLKVAVVMTSALSRMQAARVAKLTGQDLFNDVDAALDALTKQAG